MSALEIRLRAAGKPYKAALNANQQREHSLNYGKYQISYS